MNDLRRSPAASGESRDTASRPSANRAALQKKRLFFLRATTVLVLALALALDAAFFIVGDREFSPLENRNLQTRPAPSLQGVVSGRYEARFDAYVADQFPLRNAWIALKSTLDRLAGRTESNGVFLGKDGYLIQAFQPPTPDSYDATLDALRAFLNRHADMPEYVMIAPTAVTVLADKLPALADGGGEGDYLDRLLRDLSDTPATLIDLRPDFEAAKADTQLYYRTDHHWTTDGACVAYRRLAGVAGLSGDAGRFDRVLLSNGFQGTLSAASGFRMSQREDLWACLPPEEVQCVVTHVNENVRSASLFDAGRLDSRDQYAVFLGGNYPHIRIETTENNGRTLLVLKDSYANCLIPLLTRDYQKVVVVDPRYFTGDLEVTMQAEGVNELLILYNAETLASDAALRADIA